MIIYYVCNKNIDNHSFERALANELQKNGFELWSDRVPLNFGSISAIDLDDRFGNTNVAVLMIDELFMNNDDNVDVIKKVLRYATIKFLFVLEDVDVGRVKKYIADKFPDLLEHFIETRVFFKNDGLLNLSSKIGIVLHASADESQDRISTGIEVIDYLLGGGFRLGSSLNIIGPRGSGKTTLGIQFQKAALETGRGCLYITYSEAPIKILRRFESIKCDITKYIKNGRFRIFDSYSSLNGLTSESVRLSVGDEWYPSIIRVEDPMDSETYFNNQIEAIKAIGPGGVNIIDCVNKRYEIAQQQRAKNGLSYKEHFTRFKAMAGDALQNVGVHIVTFGSSDDKELLNHLIHVQDGNIRLRQIKDDCSGSVIRELCIDESGQIGRGDTKWYKYVIRDTGVAFLPVDFDTNQ